MKQEFNIGDKVTFRAYPDQQISAVVKEVISPNKGIFNTDVFTYRLSGVNESLVTVTSGKSIIESDYFECPVNNPFTWN